MSDPSLDIPGFFDMRLRNRKQDLAVRLVSRLAYGIVFALAFALAFGIIVRITHGLAGGVADVVRIVLVVALTIGSAFGIGFGIVEWAEKAIPADDQDAAPIMNPMMSWRTDRALSITKVVIGLAITSVAGFVLGFQFGPPTGLAIGFTIVPALGLIFGLLGHHRAWVAYLIATYTLAGKRKLPRQLMPFLDDAHRLGLLRTVGSTYQFRHVELQEYLARKYKDK